MPTSNTGPNCEHLNYRDAYQMNLKLALNMMSWTATLLSIYKISWSAHHCQLPCSVTINSKGSHVSANHKQFILQNVTTEFWYFTDVYNNILDVIGCLRNVRQRNFHFPNHYYDIVVMSYKILCLFLILILTVLP